MSATILSFFRVKTNSNDWTQEELSEFYRVEAALLQSNMPVVTDRGMSDEGDPWFVFCREDTGEIIAHFARLGGQYIIVSSAFSGVARGRDFRTLIRELMTAHPLMLPRNSEKGQKVFIHPAALLVALVATSFIISSEKDLHDYKGAEHKDAVRLFSLNDFAMLSAVAVAVSWVENQLDSTFRLVQDHDDALFGNHVSDAATSKHSSLVANEHIELDNAFVNAVHKFMSDVSASDVNLASTSASEKFEAPQIHVQSLVGQTSFVNIEAILAPATTSDAAKYYDIVSLNAADATQTLAAPVSELNNFAGTAPTLVDPTPSHVMPVSGGPSSDGGSGSVSSGTTNSGSASMFSASSDAYKTLVSEFAASGPVTPILLTTQNVSIDGAIQQAMSHVGYQPNMIQSLNSEHPANSDTTQSTTVDAPTTNVADTVDGSPKLPAAFAVVAGNTLDPQTVALVSSFIQQTPHIQIDVVGTNFVVVDTNTTDIWNSNFGMQSWKMGDGSTLTIVGIIPHLIQAGMGGGSTTTS